MATPKQPASPTAPSPDPISPLQPIIQDFTSPDWTSPLWWVGVITSVISELVVVLTLAHVWAAEKFLTGISQSQIVIVAQILAVAAPTVLGWIHHRSKVASQQAHAQSLVSYNNAVAQIHINQATARMELLVRGAAA